MLESGLDNLDELFWQTIRSKFLVSPFGILLFYLLVSHSLDSRVDSRDCFSCNHILGRSDERHCGQLQILSLPATLPIV